MYHCHDSYVKDREQSSENIEEKSLINTVHTLLRQKALLCYSNFRIRDLSLSKLPQRKAIAALIHDKKHYSLTRIDAVCLRL